MDNYLPIENYGVIGDLRTVALVGINGSIDFLCFPNFDSPSVFSAILDNKKGGFFQIIPIDENVKMKQIYLTDTNILITRFLLENAIGELTDFMPAAPLFKKNILIRKVKNIHGKIKYRLVCSPRFNYARSTHDAKLNKKEILFTSHGEDKLAIKLTSSVPLKLREKDGYAEFTLNTGEEAEFMLENVQQGKVEVEDNFEDLTEKAFEQTLNFWKDWASKSSYNGRWREMVIRSALVLKLLISSQYGSIIAAPTFSLPEKIGGNKNWDYRFAWIRDAAFTVYALMRIGFNEEAKFFMEWIQKLCDRMEEGAPLFPFYSFDGRVVENEISLKNLEGYRKSKPVRIGNAASKQLQIDIYGEYIDSIYIYDKYVAPISHDNWLALCTQLDWLLKHWEEKDYGIWEIRGQVKEFLHSRFMSWVAVDRMIRIGTHRSFPFPTKWVTIRNKIYNSVFEDFWCEKRQAFTQFKGSRSMDASTLLMPLIRFISPKDPRWLSTLENIEKDLAIDCLVYRYKPEQSALFGLTKGEGTFTACSFWYIECLSKAGQLDKAEFYFDKMLSYSNHLGLYSEQLGAQGEHLGNFPQAFTHLSLISAAFDLNKRISTKICKR